MIFSNLRIYKKIKISLHEKRKNKFIKGLRKPFISLIIFVVPTLPSITKALHYTNLGFFFFLLRRLFTSLCVIFLRFFSAILGKFFSLYIFCYATFKLLCVFPLFFVLDFVSAINLPKNECISMLVMIESFSMLLLLSEMLR